jgi:excisionase family DNA binding protein
MRKKLSEFEASTPNIQLLGGKRYHGKRPEALRLSVCDRTLENWVRLGVIPMIKIGRRCLFDPDAVDRALAERTVNAGR